MSSGEYRPLEWTPNLVERFWNYQTGVRPDSYFALNFGAGIVASARAFLPPGGRILDYGCGPGFLLDQLKNDFAFAGFDTTESSVSAARARLGREKNFLALYTRGQEPPKASFDVVFLVETIEHISPADFRTLGANLVDYLRPGGKLVVTTPNDEDLSRATTFCPCCEHTFHMWQHVRSFDKNAIEMELKSLGLVVQHTAATDFGLPLGHRSLPRRFVRKALGRKPPHLLCIATKPHGDEAYR